MSQPFTRKELYYTRRTPAGLVQGERLSIETEIIVRAAEEMGLSWKPIENTQLIELSDGTTTQIFRRRMPASTSFMGSAVCKDKNATRELLQKAGLSVTPGFFITKADPESYYTTVFEALKKPVVAKVSQGTHGDGVFVGITSLEDFIQKVRSLLQQIVEATEVVLAEEQFAGKEYRIVVTRDKVLGIMHRVPCNVIGDGTHTIAELIAQKNTDPMRNIEHWLYPHIEIDPEMIEIMESQGLNESSVVPRDHQVFLRKVSNIMAGGDAVDYTDLAHPSVFEIAQKAIQAIPGLSWTGIDFMTTDITKQQDSSTYTIIEMNGSPEFAMHDIPMIGKKRGLAEAFVRLLFPAK